MDFGNALVEALRRRTATRVYGTPFYATELAKRAQQVQGGALENQLAQFKLGQEQALAPGELEQQGLKTTGLKTANELASAKQQKLEQEVAGYHAAQQAANDLKEAQAELARAKGPAAQTVAQARMLDAQARMHKAMNPTAGGASYSPVQGVDAEGNPTFGVFDRKTGQYGLPPGTAGAPSTSAAAPGAPPAAGGIPGFRPKSTADTAEARNRRDQATIVLGEATPLLEQIEKLKGQIGPVRGNVNRGLDTLGLAPPAVRNLRTQLRVVADLLPKLHGYRGGTQMATEFKNMVGDINQGPEQLKSSLEAVIGVANLIQNGASQGQIEAATDAARQRIRGGGLTTPAQGATPATSGSKYKLISVE